MRSAFLQVLGWVARLSALAGIVAVSTGGCDWFNGPEQANNLPHVRMVSTCPGAGAEPVVEGDDVTFVWSGHDVEGPIRQYRWTYDDGQEVTEDVTTDTLHTIEDVVAGEGQAFEVWAVDGEGDLSRDPATCEFTVFESAQPGTLVGRVVLAEFVSGLGCPNCPDARDGLSIVLDEYGRDSLAVVAYYSEPHPLGPEEVYDLLEDYFGTPSPDGLPIVFIDHAYDEPLIGATTPEAAAARYRERIDERRALGSPLTIRMAGDISLGEVMVTVDVEYPLTGGPYVLKTMLVEDNISLYNENHMFVVRDILEDEALTVAAVGDSAEVERDFAIDPGWTVSQMDVIAFVQDEVTFEVLQASRLRTE